MNPKGALRHFSLPINLAELGGAFGDIGTLLPLMIAYIALNGANAFSIFSIVGLTYIAVGLFYRVPVSVQPMKAIAAIAIAQGLAPGVISAAALLMGIFLLILSVTRWSQWLPQLFTKPVVRGIQLALALLLLRIAVGLMVQPQPGISPTGGSLLLSMPAGLIVAALGAGLGLMFLKNRPLPASLVIIAFGLGISGWSGSFAPLNGLNLGVSLPHFFLPTASELSLALALLIIPQLPLTLGNSVVATADTTAAYFGEKARRVRPTTLCLSMGLTNLVSGLAGSIPLCHGAGGVSAHYRFGARTGKACIAIGSLLLLLPFLFGNNLSAVLALVPFPVLGVLLLFTAIQHALFIRDVRRGQDWLIVASIALTSTLLNQLALGILLGLVLFHSVRYCQKRFIYTR